jgi:hypothetical protein
MLFGSRRARLGSLPSSCISEPQLLQLRTPILLGDDGDFGDVTDNPAIEQRSGYVR